MEKACPECNKTMIEKESQAICSELGLCLEFIELQDKLLICYRIGKHPGDKLLDRIYKCRTKIDILKKEMNYMVIKK